mmetsp:Transcript_36771/g.105990  ORF Transcript_36771/g.105990 Transcript_36771/m.105990 type:complete len:579 (-) Transcript_36771:50-1786(-)
MAGKRKETQDGGYDATALYVGDVPDTWRAEDVEELHRSVGLGGGGLVDVKLLPKRLPGETTCGIFRYADALSASTALAALSGMPVETSSGQQKALRARYADQQQKSGKAPRTDARATAPAALGDRGWTMGGPAPLQMRHPQVSPPNASQQTSVYVSEVPSEFTEQSLQAFHASLGLSPLLGVKFLPRRISSETGSAILRYATPAAAQQAALRLQGHPVNLSTGFVKYLIAKVADPRKADEPPPVVNFLPGEAPPAGTDPSSLYLADVPLALNAEAMSKLHQDSGLEAPASAKYLPQKLDDETCCVILRYDEAESARRAIHVLQGISVKTPSGKQKVIKARYACAKRGDGAEGGQEEAPPHFHSVPSRPRPRDGEEDHSALPSAYVSDLPGSISEEGVRQLLSEAGLDGSVMASAKFLPQRIQANSICALLRCFDMSGVNDIVSMLNGYQVQLPNGQIRHLIARVADPPKVSGKAASATNPAAPELTDLYMSEVPVDWTEDTVISVHAEAGVDPSSLASVKILERRHSSYPTGSAILRYVDHFSASNAMALLQGRPVPVPGGTRTLAIRYADPPKKSRR